jgi:hypothetical protein
MTLSLCELFRAYTVAPKGSLFRLGSSRTDGCDAVIASITLLLLVCVVPFGSRYSTLTS